MRLIKKFLSITIFIFCFLIAIGLLDSILFDSITGTEILSCSIVGYLSFLLAKWLWHTSGKALNLNSFEVNDSFHLETIQSSSASISFTNWISKTSIALCLISGIVSLYIYFVPYKLALARVSEPPFWIGPLCLVEVAIAKEAWGCHFIGKPIINGIRKSIIENQIASLESWLFILAFVFVLSLVVAFLSRKIAAKN
jgi:hypothetical protein